MDFLTSVLSLVPHIPNSPYLLFSLPSLGCLTTGDLTKEVTTRLVNSGVQAITLKLTVDLNCGIPISWLSLKPEEALELRNLRLLASQAGP